MTTYVVKPNNILGSFFKTLDSYMSFKILRKSWKNIQNTGRKWDAILKYILYTLLAISQQSLPSTPPKCC